MKFCFADMVVVEKSLIGVVVKSWCGSEPKHDVYVRMYNEIKTYKESEMQRYMVRHKYLDEQELKWNRNAVEGNSVFGTNVSKDEFIESCRCDFEDEEDFEEFKDAANSFVEFCELIANGIKNENKTQD